MSFDHISLVCHSDWSVSPHKRWVVCAALGESHRWRVSQPIPVGDPTTFFIRLGSQFIAPGCLQAGFDFPIGLPSTYAQKAGISDFLAVLPLLGMGGWQDFYQPATSPAEISLQRPFYPARPGNSRRSHLEGGLELSFAQLHRLCEMAHDNRRAACPLFWTLGSQQVGKAAIHGWQHLLAPALAQPGLNLKIWPFSGHLDELCLPGNIVVVETYPAEFYGHLGILNPADRMSKRSQADRRFYSEKLLSQAGRLKLDLHPGLIDSIEAGFDNLPDGEDRFDALVGLYGMINVVEGNHSSGEPVPPHISKIEGWIFGQAQPERGR